MQVTRSTSTNVHANGLNPPEVWKSYWKMGRKILTHIHSYTQWNVRISCKWMHADCQTTC